MFALKHEKGYFIQRSVLIISAELSIWFEKYFCDFLTDLNDFKEESTIRSIYFETIDNPPVTENSD